MKTNKTIIPFTLQYKIGCKIGYNLPLHIQHMLMESL